MNNNLKAALREIVKIESSENREAAIERLIEKSHPKYKCLRSKLKGDQEIIMKVCRDFHEGLSIPQIAQKYELSHSSARYYLDDHLEEWFNKRHIMNGNANGIVHDGDDIVIVFRLSAFEKRYFLDKWSKYTDQDPRPFLADLLLNQDKIKKIEEEEKENEFIRKWTV